MWGRVEAWGPGWAAQHQAGTPPGAALTSLAAERHPSLTEHLVCLEGVGPALWVNEWQLLPGAVVTAAGGLLAGLVVCRHLTWACSGMPHMLCSFTVISVLRVFHTPMCAHLPSTSSTPSSFPPSPPPMLSPRCRAARAPICSPAAVNRWLAVYIGAASARMMAAKDER